MKTQRELQFASVQTRKNIAHCPCGKSNKDGKFSPYDGFTDKGYCHSCQKIFYPRSEYTPYHYSYNRSKQDNKKLYKQRKNQSSALPIVLHTIPDNMYHASFDPNRRNCFFMFLDECFGQETAQRLSHLYRIGSHDRYYGTIFWYVDLEQRVRSGKIMHYDPKTGKRIKDQSFHVSWVHTQLPNFQYSACLFGEHLLDTADERPVGIVESEKTAIIATAYMPDTLWLATGSKSNIKAERLMPCKHRSLLLYPDNDGYEQWSAYADTLHAHGYKVSVSTLLHNRARDGEDNYDLADYLLQR